MENIEARKRQKLRRHFWLKDFGKSSGTLSQYYIDMFKESDKI
jgi:hypothetical protein